MFPMIASVTLSYGTSTRFRRGTYVQKCAIFASMGISQLREGWTAVEIGQEKCRWWIPSQYLSSRRAAAS